jgi:anti-sigma B factor antagonist
MPLDIESRQSGNAVVVSCRGVIVFGPEAVQLRDEIKRALEKSKRLVLDLTEVHYVDSGGLGAIVGALTSVRNAGGDLKLAGMNERVQHVFHITKLTNIIEAHATVEQAVAAVAHAAA